MCHEQLASRPSSVINKRSRMAVLLLRIAFVTFPFTPYAEPTFVSIAITLQSMTVRSAPTQVQDSSRPPLRLCFRSSPESESQVNHIILLLIIVKGTSMR